MHPFKLELPSGEPADPPRFVSSEPNWRVGDAIYVAPGRRLRVVGLYAGTADDEEQRLIVEPDG